MGPELLFISIYYVGQIRQDKNIKCLISKTYFATP